MRIDNWFYVIKGRFWSGKTNYATKLIKELVEKWNTYIFTDIKTIYKEKNNVFFVQPTEKVIKTITDRYWKQKEMTVNEYTLQYILDVMYEMRLEWDKRSDLDRDHRPHFVLFLDECASVFDKYNTDQEQISRIKDYIVQIRKLTWWTFIITQEVERMSLSIRSLVKETFYNRPWVRWLNFRPFSIRTEVRRQSIDPETWAVIIEKIPRKDDNGKRIYVDRPMDTHQCYYRRSSYWSYYDDLYLNITIDDIQRPALPWYIQKFQDQ